MIGSRETPNNILSLVIRLSRILAKQGKICRSGGAPGMDAASESGFPFSQKEIFIPWNGFNDRFVRDGYLLPFHNFDKCLKIASKIHPRWDSLKLSHKKLHARNVYQILGKDLNLKSNLVLLYAPIENNSVKGGTRTGFELARKLNIPCLNLYDENVRNSVIEYLEFYSNKL